MFTFSTPPILPKFCILPKYLQIPIPQKKIAHLAISRYPFLFTKNEKINAELFPLLKLHSQFFFLMSMCYNNFCSDTSELPILFVLECIFIQKFFFPIPIKYILKTTFPS